MRTKRILPVVLAMMGLCFMGTFAFAGHGAGSEPGHEGLTEGDMINIAGIVYDTHNEPIGECHVAVFANGKEMDAAETGSAGKYVSRFLVERGTVPTTTFEVVAKKPSFAAKKVTFQGSDLAQKGDHFYMMEDLTLAREQGPAFWIATILFVLIYILISFELLHRTVAAMLGAAILMCISYTIGTVNMDWRILSYERAVAAMDMNVIMLLMGMMIIVGILKNTGVFQWCAYVSYKMSKGKVFLLSCVLMAFTAITSAFLDNVTTMLLLTGVAMEICISLNLNAIYMLIPLVFASNLGGTATLIGDPPNIMIGSFTGLTFMQFVKALTPVVVLCVAAEFLYFKIIWGKEYAKSEVSVANVDQFIKELKEKYKIYDPTLLTYGMIILGFTIFLFLSHGYWHMEVSIAAMTGASVLFTVAILTKKVNMLHLIEKDIEWPTLIFFLFLFVIVAAVEEAGLLSIIADWILNVSGGQYMMALAMILWVSAISSAFVDNIPFTATMLPIVLYLSKVIPGSENTLWWALSLGACLGGNGTIIGASANVVTMGIAESKGYHISFGKYMKIAFPIMLITVAICHIYLVIFKPA